jgi:hypothetical protein
MTFASGPGTGLGKKSKKRVRVEAADTAPTTA